MYRGRSSPGGSGLGAEGYQIKLVVDVLEEGTKRNLRGLHSLERVITL